MQMSRKLRASKLERVLLEREQQAFISWRDSLSTEQIQAIFLELLTRLARLGYLAPPPANLWSLPEAEREAYLQTSRDLDTSEHGHSAAMVAREIWLEAIGWLEPESHNQAETEQQGAASYG